LEGFNLTGFPVFPGDRKGVKKNGNKEGSSKETGSKEDS
jgi:hypothetical protein